MGRLKEKPHKYQRIERLSFNSLMRRLKESDWLWNRQTLVSFNSLLGRLKETLLTLAVYTSLVSIPLWDD